MRNIQHVSFPRSGHHLLVRCLWPTFPNEIHYCEFYQHCRQTPCSDPQTNYQKNHDFKLTLELNPSFHYIIQYRHPLEAIASWYDYHLTYARPLKRWFLLKLDSKTLWRNFLQQKIKFWRQFIEKWAIQHKTPAVCQVSYEDFLENPIDELHRVAAFVWPDRTIEPAVLERAVRKEGVQAKHQLTSFRYYDPAFFRTVEDSVAEHLAQIKVRRLLG